ncbi:MAG: hypothetical protein A2017_22235 [Lentisphaerae bacterium GWF2_44_16]|nr:MAG: hypothetical protein A2017_22235 [Lentisphaerae bacterium GWF2_44_16]
MKTRSLENKNIRVELNSETLSLRIIEKKTETNWESKGLVTVIYGQFYSYDLAQHCDVNVEKQGNRITVKFTNMIYWSRFKGHGYVKPASGPALEFEVSIILNDDHVLFRMEKIRNMDDEELSVVFPFGLTHFKSDERLKLLTPFGFGSIFEFPRKDMYSYEAPYGIPGFSMPVYGIFKEKSGLGVYVKTPFDFKKRIFINTEKNGVSGIDGSFIFNRERANYPRETAFYPMKDGNYVRLAKLYRKLLIEEGKFVTLKDKIKQNPEVEKLVGSVILKNSTFSKRPPANLKKSYSLYMLSPDQNVHEGLPENWTAKEIFDTAKERGFDRVCVYNTGWNNMGFDSGYPTRFPPNPERGSFEDFKRDAEYARSLSKDYIYSVHDNYRDVYENSDEFDRTELIADKNKIPIPGGIWRGGRAYHMCPQVCMKYAARDIPKLVEMLGKGSIYIDVMGCTRFHECHNDMHPMGHQDDMEARKKFFKYVKEQIGSVATEGCPSDCMNDVIDLGAFCYLHRVNVNPQTSPYPIPVPFWQLVYHDSILNYTSESTFRFYGSEYLLYVALYGLLPFSLEPISLKLSKELRTAYEAEMLYYDFLEPLTVSRDEKGCFWTSGVARSVFSDGTEVIANFNNAPYNYEDIEIAPRDFIIRKKLEQYLK